MILKPILTIALCGFLSRDAGALHDTQPSAIQGQKHDLLEGFKSHLLVTNELSAYDTLDELIAAPKSRVGDENKQNSPFQQDDKLSVDTISRPAHLRGSDLAASGDLTDCLVDDSTGDIIQEPCNLRGGASNDNMNSQRELSAVFPRTGPCPSDSSLTGYSSMEDIEADVFDLFSQVPTSLTLKLCPGEVWRPEVALFRPRISRYPDIRLPPSVEKYIVECASSTEGCVIAVNRDFETPMPPLRVEFRGMVFSNG